MPSRVALQETVAVPEPDTLPGVIAPHVRPDGIVSVRATVPANPPSAAMVIVDAAEEPTLTTVVVGLAEILKSGTLTVTVTEWDIVTPDPVTVTE